MATPPTPTGDDPGPRAEAIYAAWRAAAEEGASGDLEALCREHPDLAAELRALDAEWHQVAALLAGSRGTPAGGGPEPLSAAVLARLFPRLDPVRRYQVRDLYARGGMAVIHRARDRLLDRTVALKILAGPGRDADRVLRFLAEARITGQLQHPSVVPVHDLGLDARGRPFFSMELVRGRTFGEVIELARAGREGWTPARAVRVLVQVCDAVAYAHSRGVIHRDLKPANVMVGSFGEVFVMDWGLAKVLGRPGEEGVRLLPGGGEEAIREATPRTMLRPGAGTTQAGDVLGTPCYMAPEQALGDQTRIGPAADIYAAGAMLYELLAGRRPYLDGGGEGSSGALEVLERLRRGPPAPLAELAPSAPVELVAICDRAMARRPEDRYPDMQALARDLEAWLEGRVVSAWRTGLLVELQKWIQRNRALAAGIALAVLTLLGSIVGFAVVQARAARVLSWQNYLANLGAAEAALQSEDSGAAARALESVAPAWRERWEWRHLHGPRLDQARAVLAAHGDPGVRMVRVSPDGRWLASASWDGTARLWSAGSWAPGPVLAHPAQVLDLAFDAGGGRVATACYDRRARIWRAADGEMLWMSPPHPREVSAVLLDPDGHWLATGCYDGRLRLFPLEGGEQVRVLEGHLGPVYELLLRAVRDGAPQLVSAAWDGTVRLWTLDGRLLEVLGRPGSDEFWCASLSPDGRWLAAAGARRTIRLWDLEGGGEARPTAGAHRARITGLAFAPDGGRLASCSWDGRIRLWDLAAGGNLVPRAVLTGHRGWVWSVVWQGPERLLSGGTDGSVRLWDGRARGGPVPVLRDPRDRALYAAAADADRLVGGTQDGRVLVWEAGAPEPRAWLAHPGQRVLDLHVEPGGGRLLTLGDREDLALWDPADGRELLRLRHDNPVNATLRGRCAPDPAWTRVAHGRPDGAVVLRDLRDGAVLAAWQGHDAQVLAVDWSPDGGHLASGDVAGGVLVWSSQGRVTERLAGHGGPVTDLAFAPDGQRLATACWDGRVRIWSLAGELLHEQTGHTGWVSYVAWAPDGRTLASASVDGTVRLWEPRRGAALLALHGHEDVVSALAWTPQGDTLCSSSLDGTLRLWQAAPGPGEGRWQAR